MRKSRGSHKYWFLCNIFLVMMSTLNREQLILQVRGWIKQSGFTFESSPDSKYDFVLNFFEKDNLPQLQLIHQKPESAFFLIVSLVNIPKTDRDLLKRINVSSFSGLIWDLKLSLMRMGVDLLCLGLTSLILMLGKFNCACSLMRQMQVFSMK